MKLTSMQARKALVATTTVIAMFTLASCASLGATASSGTSSTVAQSAMEVAGAPTQAADATSENAATCQPASVIPGQPISATVGGMEGPFNGTPTNEDGSSLPCDEWDQQILDHPDSALINTTDNTFVEGYDRTHTGALDQYRDLGDGFVVPNPDPHWPAGVLVLIDARTGELLETMDLPQDLGPAEDTFVEDEG
ncbi:hypothetical protein [Demequina aurantiaca]|uniref:hypothetical protein n=1 Tax=Demequina aurantiaca TaxID=676200 RepID=UPI003D346B2D